jgi:hypothetical protein
MNDGYREWLLGLLIKYGINTYMPNSVGQGPIHMAYQYSHVTRLEDDDFRLIGYTLNPSAKRYLENHETSGE